MKRPRTRVAEAIALRAYHVQMGWLHKTAKNENPRSWNGIEEVRWMTGKKIDKPCWII